MSRIQVYVKRELKLGRLNPTQLEMFELGEEALSSVRARLTAGLGPTDSPLPALGKYYQRLKERITGRPARRDARFGFERGPGGRFYATPLDRQLLPNLRIRTVSENYAEASNTTEGNVRRYRRVQQERGGKPSFRLVVGARPKARALDEWSRRKTGAGFLAFSPRNKSDVLRTAQSVLRRAAGRVVVARDL